MLLLLREIIEYRYKKQRLVLANTYEENGALPEKVRRQYRFCLF